MEAKKVMLINLGYEEWKFLESFLDKTESCCEELNKNNDLKIEIDEVAKDTLSNLYDSIGNLLDILNRKEVA